ncbi:MAG: PDZ domain-containing protein, partial [Planctomycetota bacterium]
APVAAEADPAFLGVAVAESPARADRSATPSPTRPVELTVTSVHPGSPAEAAGLQAGDTLLKLDDQWLLHPVQLRRLVGGMPVDREVELTVIRDDETQTLAATLQPRPAELAARVPHEFPDPAAVRPDWPAEFEDMLRLSPLPVDADIEDFRRMHERMRQRFDRFFESPDLVAPGAGRGWPGLDGMRRQSIQVIDDGEHRLTVTTNADGRHLKAAAAGGALLFDGPIDTPEQLDAVPDAVRKKLPTTPSPAPAPRPVGRAI